MISASWSSLPEMWDYLAGECGELTAIVDPIHPPDMPGGKRAPKGAETRLTYSEMRTNVGTMAAALVGLGLQKEVRIQDACSLVTWLVAARSAAAKYLFNDFDQYQYVICKSIKIIVQDRVCVRCKSLAGGAQRRAVAAR